MGRSFLHGFVLRFFLLLFFLSGTPVAAQEQIVVDVNTSIADVSRRPIGINVNFLLDDDRNRAEALTTLAEALKRAGVKYLRYPGGEKADGYLWSVPPYTSSVPTLARWATGEWPDNQEWPSYDRFLVNADGHTFRTDPLSFDEFMAICKEIDCVPTIVVCYDSMYKPAQPGGVAPTRAQLLETAREWVRYANITRGYGVKYWEIGNETWQPHYNGSASAAAYAKDLVEFSSVMKGIDPSIMIGANGESLDWWRTVLTGASSSIDFLAVHNYPAYEWGSYTHYRDNNPPLMDAIVAARNAIAAYAPAGDRDRLEIAATETGPADWSGLWPHMNDMGHAIVLFDLFGKHLVEPGVAFAQLWGTRWSGNDSAKVPSVLDAFDKDNDLQATGQVLAIWGQFLKDQMVASTSTNMIRTYSTLSPATRALTVFLVNKDTSARSAALRIDNLSASMAVERWVFKGNGPGDLYPTWANYGAIPASGSTIPLTLDPVSVTVLDIRPAAAGGKALPGTVEAEDFDTFLDWTPGNYGGQYRPTAVDIQPTADAGGGYNVGWFEGGEWLGYAVQVQSGGSYRLSARVASPFDGATMRWMIDGAVAAALNVPNTGDWQAWQTIQSPAVSIGAGAHEIRLVSDTGGFNLNRFSLDVASAAVHIVPGTFQAEDFDAFWDATPENSGGQYRSTAVDIEATVDTGGGHNVGWITAGEWLEYTIDVRTSGTYQLSARLAAPGTGSSLRIRVDDGAPMLVNVPMTGGWQTWTTVRSPGMFISAGSHRVRIATDTGGFNMNWIGIDPASTGGGITIEAEDFNTFQDWTPQNFGGEYRSTAVDIERSSDAGGGYNIGWFDPGEWLEYVIQIGTSGTYEISARVASPLSGASLNLAIDGSPAVVAGVPNSGGWQAWQTVRIAEVHLTAGTHRLRVSTATGGLNLNRLGVAVRVPR